MPVPSGVIAARNAGLACALREFDADFICFLDNDAFLAPNAIEEMVAAADDPQIGMVAPKAFQSMTERILASAGGLTVNFYLGLFRDIGYGERDTGQHDTAADVCACPGFAILVPTRVARETGPFDEGLKRYGWEDVDFSLRIAKLGYRLRYAPKAEVEHRGGHAGRRVVASYEYWKLRNLVVLQGNHANRLQWLCFLGSLPLRATYVLCRFAIDIGCRRVVAPRLRQLRARFGVH